MRCLRNSVLLLLLSLAFSVFEVYAQKEIDVNPAKGLLTIKLPVYTFDMIDFKVDLGYMYAGRGFKPGITGASRDGWSFYGGGTITRILRGVNDEKTPSLPNPLSGWLYGAAHSVPASFSPYDDNDENNCTDEGNNATWLTSNYQNSDFEPDEYMVEAPGLNFKMVADNNGNFRAIPAQDIKIETYIGFNNYKYFRITTQKGIKYTFNTASDVDRELLYPQTDLLRIFGDQKNKYASTLNYVDVWYLTKIESTGTAGYVSLDYEYETNGGMSLDEDVNVFMKDVNADTAVSNSIYKVNFSADFRKCLKSVTSSFGTKVVIPFYNYRARPMLFGIYNTIKEYGSPADRVVYFDVRSDTADFCRGFLNRMVERLPNGKEQRLYGISYYLPDPVAKLRINSAKKVDAWGYFNGSAGTTAVPRIYVYPEFKSTTGVYRPYPIPGYSGETYTLPGNDGTANEDFMAYAAVSAITYPDGGKTLFEYESNSFIDENRNTEVKGGGLRIKGIYNFDNLDSNRVIQKKYTYKNDLNQSSGTINVLPAFAIAMPYYRSLVSNVTKSYASIVATYGVNSLNYWNHLTARLDYDAYRGESQVSYSQVTISETGNGKIKQVYSTPTSFWYLADKPISYPAEICNSSNGTFITKSYYQYPFAPIGNAANGDLLKEFIYNETGSLLKKTEYEYENYYSSPQRIYGLRVDYSLGLSQLSKYAIDLNHTILKQTKETNYDSSLSGNGILVQKDYDNSAYDRKVRSIKTTNSDNSESKTSFWYSGDFLSTNISEVSANSSLEGIVLLNNSYNRAAVIESTSSLKPSGSGTFLTREAGASLYGKNIVAGVAQPVLKELKSLKSTSGLSDFAGMSVSGSSPSKVLNLDSRYKTTKAFADYTKNHQPTKITEARLVTSIVNDTLLKVPLLVVKGAERSNFLFANFEKVDTLGNLPASYSSTQYETLPYFGKTVKLGSGNSMGHNFSRKTEDKFYKIAFLCKAPATTQITIKIVANYITYTIATITINPSTDFQFYEKELDLTSYTAGRLNIIASGDVQLDNVIFYPTNAQFTMFNYENPFTKKMEMNSFGQLKLFDYDPYGRLIAERDIAQNIKKAKFYSRPIKPGDSLGRYMAITFLDSVNNIAGLNLKFSADNLAATPGTKYVWDFGDGTTIETYESTVTHEYAAEGNYKVKVSPQHPEYVNHPEYQPSIYRYFKNIQIRPSWTLLTDFCSSGITTINPCYGIYNYTDCGDIPGEIDSPNGTKFIAMSIGCSGVTTYKWQTSTNGINFTSYPASDDYQDTIYIDKSKFTPNFYVRCIITMLDCNKEFITNPIRIQSNCSVF